MICSASSKEPLSSKSSLLLLAHHHCSDNIASQRFLGLIKHLSREHHSVRIISGPAPDETVGSSDPEITIFEEPLLSKASFVARLEVLWCMLVSRRSWLFMGKRKSWISNAVSEGRAYIHAEKRRGQPVVVMATYSPIDALIAARLIADSENVPLIQDFRDGLAFENLGRPGKVFFVLRKLVEAWSISSASVISTVSRPLVSYFQETYPKKEVCLLYNGFDCAKFDSLGVESSKIKNESSQQSISIGHFGRVSASESARLQTLQMFLKIFEAGQFDGCLEFFGTLTETEKVMLADADLPCKAHGHIDRTIALENMGEMNALLILTGKNQSVATGKIYEYLFSGKRIILATQCQNEASRILAEIGDDDIILNFSDSAAIPALDVLEEKLAQPFSRNSEAIKRFDKSVQAQQLSQMLSRLSEGVH